MIEGAVDTLVLEYHVEAVKAAGGSLEALLATLGRHFADVAAGPEAGGALMITAKR